MNSSMIDQVLTVQSLPTIVWPLNWLQLWNYRYNFVVPDCVIVKGCRYIVNHKLCWITALLNPHISCTPCNLRISTEYMQRRNNSLNDSIQLIQLIVDVLEIENYIASNHILDPDWGQSFTCLIIIIIIISEVEYAYQIDSKHWIFKA